MKFRPCRRVVVRRIEEDTKTAGGISFPTPPKRSLCKARSSPLDRGPRRVRQIVPLEVKKAIGFCSANGPAPRADRWPELLIMKESDILGIIEERYRCGPRPSAGSWVKEPGPQTIHST